MILLSFFLLRNCAGLYGMMYRSLFRQCSEEEPVKQPWSKNSNSLELSQEKVPTGLGIRFAVISAAHVSSGCWIGFNSIRVDRSSPNTLAPITARSKFPLSLRSFVLCRTNRT